VTKETGFAAGLYNEVEADPEQLKDKQAKVDFLNKAISVVSFALNETIDVSANKIVAGMEPGKTNAFLVKLHQAATTCGAAEEAVQRCLAGETVAAPKEKRKKKEGDDAAAVAAAYKERRRQREKREEEKTKWERWEEKRRKAEEEAAAAAAAAAEAPAGPSAEDAAAAEEEEQRKKATLIIGR
jgi:TRAF3-interacting protein 1